MNDYRIIITGGSGFIGTNLCEHLIEKNYDFINLDINPPKISNHYEYWREIDIRNKGGKFIVLNSRENAIDFYKTLNYSITKKTNLLYEKIQHYEMLKIII